MICNRMKNNYCPRCASGPCVEETATGQPIEYDVGIQGTGLTGDKDKTYCTQYSPWPIELADLVTSFRYRPGWIIQLEDKDRGQGSRGLTLVITTKGYDSYHPEHGENYCVNHYMPVPPAAYNRQSWQRWLLDQCLLVERHECCEFFVVDGKRPYAPHHGPGNDPYIIFERGTDKDARTMYTGEVKPAPDKLAVAGKISALHDEIKSIVPNPKVQELFDQYDTDKIDAATFGSGIFDLMCKGKDGEESLILGAHVPILNAVEVRERLGDMATVLKAVGKVHDKEPDRFPRWDLAYINSIRVSKHDKVPLTNGECHAYLSDHEKQSLTWSDMQANDYLITVP